MITFFIPKWANWVLTIVREMSKRVRPYCPGSRIWGNIRMVVIKPSTIPTYEIMVFWILCLIIMPT